MAQSNPKPNKQKKGVCVGKRLQMFQYPLTPLYEFPKLAPADPNFFLFFLFKFGGKTFFTSQDICQFSARKEFLDAGGGGGWKLKIYGQSAISDPAEPRRHQQY